jgi:predicted nucleic acid-binding protein
VLAYPHLKKYHVNSGRAIKFISEIGVHFTLIHPIKSYIPADKNDDYLIALALQTNSGFITSGDQHILLQKPFLEAKYKKLKILTKAQFEKMFK